MRVFVYEYTCASGMAGPLQAEGRAMLSAFLEDFGRAPGIEIVTLVDERWCGHPYQAACLRLRAADQEKAFRELAATADATLVIAPEFEGILLTRCRWVLESGGRLCGPSLAAVELTGDKLALCRHLRDRGLPTPESHPVVPYWEPKPADFPLVWKPRYGAGSQATFLVRNLTEFRCCPARARREGSEAPALVQPFVPGTPASVAFLAGPCGYFPLLPAAQRLSSDGRFHFLGGSIPLPAELTTRALRVALQAVEAVPDLQGYCGVDIVLGHAQDGSGDAVIEINPRPTTSYVGLRVLAETNLAAALVQVALRNQLPDLVWRSGRVEFAADGTVGYHP